MELRQYLMPLYRWWWLLVIATVLAAVTSFLAGREQPATYRSRSALLIGNVFNNPYPNGAEFWLGQQLAQTYADIAQRQPVRDQAMKALGLLWLPEYRVTVPSNTLLLEINVTDTDPLRAQAVAQELANQLVLVSPTGPRPNDQARQVFITQQLTTLEEQIQSTNEQIQARQGDLGRLDSARQIADVTNQIGGLQNKLNTLQANYAALLTSTRQGAINSLSIIENASTAVQTGPDVFRTVVAATAVGLTLAVGAAYFLDYLDDTLKSAEEIAALVKIPLLGSVVSLSRDQEPDRGLVVSKHPRSAIAESFRALRTGIQFSTMERPGRLLLVTSSSPGEGKSTVTANLALVLSQANQRVLLIDADLRRPAQHSIFKLSNLLGLTSLLLEVGEDADLKQVEAAVAGVANHTEYGIDVITSGPIPPNPSELLGLTRLKHLLDHLLGLYDYVVLDSAPVLPVTDTVVLSTRAQGVLVVVEAKRTRRGRLKRAVQALENVNANVIGLVLNRVDPEVKNLYYYYYELKGGGTDNSAESRRNGHTRRRRRVTFTDS